MVSPESLCTRRYSEGTAGIYGMCASLPATFIEESVKVYLDTYTITTPAEEEAR